MRRQVTLLTAYVSSPGTVTFQVLYTAVCQMFGNAGRYDDAWATFDGMSAVGVPRDTILYTYMISLSGKVRAVRLAALTKKEVHGDARAPGLGQWLLGGPRRARTLAV